MLTVQVAHAAVVPRSDSSTGSAGTTMACISANDAAAAAAASRMPRCEERERGRARALTPGTIIKLYGQVNGWYARAVATEPAAVEQTPPESARRGRPRSRGYDEAILDATLRLLGELGYARMSMDAIAAEAGVSKPTIYARYRGKADLATAALRHLRETGAPAATGDLRADLVAQLRQLRENVERLSLSSLVGTCLTEQVHNPELLELFRERTVIPAWRSCATSSPRRASAGRSVRAPTSRPPRCSSWARSRASACTAATTPRGGRSGSLNAMLGGMLR